MVKPSITRLMSQKMDRRDFLRYSGGILLAVIGVTGLVNTIFKAGGQQTQTSDKPKSNGYGMSPYGK